MFGAAGHIIQSYTSKPVVGYGSNNMVTVQDSNPGFEPATTQSLAQRANQLRYPGPQGRIESVGKKRR
jgi:hypothetical protein